MNTHCPPTQQRCPDTIPTLWPLTPILAPLTPGWRWGWGGSSGLKP